MSRLTAEEAGRAIERLEARQCDDLADALNLWGWGLWSRIGMNKMGMARPAYVFSAKGLWEPDLRRYIPVIGDDEAMRIDAAIARLRPSQQSVVKAIYKDWITWRYLPERLGVGKETIRRIQHEALGALEVILTEPRKSA